MSPLPGRIIGSSGIADPEDIWPSQRNRRLSADDIERMATLDPTSRMSKGTLQAMLRRSTDPTDPARPLVEALLAVPVQDPPAAAYVNPAKATHRPSGSSKRPLTPTDIEWIKALPSDPSKVSAEDAATLADMVQNHASQSDLRFLRTFYEPVWNYHDVAEQQQERRSRRQEAETTKAARSRQIEQLAVNALAAHIQAEFPELREYEARNRAAEPLRDRWADKDLELQAQIDANPTWQTPTPRPMPGIEGLSSLAEARERGQHERKRSEATPGPFEGMKIIGG